MRVLLGLLAALAMAATAPALGGLLVTGAGFGTYASNDGATVCADAPFTAQALYTPDGRGSLTSAFAGVTTCTGTLGATLIAGGVALNGTQAPPVQLVFFCTGSEAAGMHCEVLQGDTLITADVGPYAGPGSLVALGTRGAYRFDGAFTAV